MKLKVDKSESYNWSIVVDEKELRRLDEIIKEALKDGTELRLEYDLKFSDGSLIETSDINEIVLEENPKNRQIKYIGISASSEKLSKKISISLGKKNWVYENVSFSISGDSRDWVYLTSSKIEERIKNLKQWYSIFPKIDPFLILIAIFVLIQIYAGLQPKKETTKGVTIFEFSEIIFILLIAFGLLILTYKLIKRGYSYLFPLVVFRIGDGIKCHDDIVKLRGQILWGVIISLIVSVSAGLMILKITS